ncbi:MAG: hypothetical protein E7667_05145 [Ruminococcaceae bacterium]|nr:hypothetical protein [Oscillospiraceae bacterium]
MKNRFLTNILIVLLLICALVSCGKYQDALGKSTETETEKPSDDVADGNTESEDDNFSVTLIFDGDQYIPDIPIYAKWTDDKSYHEAAFDETGVAKISGLDGDYQVTLSDVPEGYTYNPNAYVATNNSKNVTIELYKCVKSRTGGGGLYNCIAINKLSVYRAALENDKSQVFFEFTPSESGTYSIESWVNVTDNTVNPLIDVYTGSSAAKFFHKTLDEGGKSSTYTKNFKYEINVDERMIGNTYTFAIRAESEKGFPVNVDFAVQLDGGFKIDWSTSVLMIPQAELKSVQAPIGRKLVGPEINLSPGKYRFDGTMYGLNEDDGYYHKYNEATGKYDGELLFAYISSPCRFLDDAFTTIEYHGNKALTVSNGTENYKFFIEGSGTVGYFCVNISQPPTKCPCILNGCGGVCVDGCKECMSECNTVSQEEYDGMRRGGYANYVNSDGLCPVTQELKDFLQKYSVNQRLFNDGNGWVENNDIIDVDALEDDQWLFACAYYEGFTNLP